MLIIGNSNNIVVKKLTIVGLRNNDVHTEVMLREKIHVARVGKINNLVETN